MKKLSVSNGNIKMGKIKSISLPPIVTCRSNAPCTHDCYARHMETRWKNCKSAWANNYCLWKEAPEIFELYAICAAYGEKIFRWHVSGDIPDPAYFEMMVRVAKKCKDTKFFAFTKRFEIVNSYLKKHRIPKNLVIVFSAWEGLVMDNPYNLPVADVIPKQDKDKYCPMTICSGHCQDCKEQDRGCWTMKKGDTIHLIKH